ncbi:uncharacterized protein YqgV (UPF0045/DUF77 family) [Lewinella aquimaris]|uniref:Uncharacterized protein YqgV (UPF0045/DUF77 family) n=1 Tax=Neolewinella aquimaris TaxID=1835722 RepID=A0A840E152_9BACT|nr:YkoF family thiamine/hydroxymethylpyrimidine-binding protein [Neolewinella aquimaris]MBB4079264.1 uncharacterized protein YqgV (UPF0045/DUF77 family) [Neolewinella aquimaris]
MIVSLDVSLYPLSADYEAPIIAFIERLNTFETVKVGTNNLSTQVRGEYADVMAAITAAMEPTLADPTKCSFVIKLLNVDVEPANTWR